MSIVGRIGKSWFGDDREAAESARAETEKLFATLDALRGEIATMAEAREQDRIAIGDLRRLIDGLAQRLGEESDKAHRTARDLVELARTVDEGAQSSEALRLRFVALSEQVAWDAENVRKAVQAAVEAADARTGSAN